MNSVFLPKIAVAYLKSINSGTTHIFDTSSFLWYFGFVASILNQGFLFGIISLLSAPFWVIYAFFTAFSYGSSFDNYMAAIAGYQNNSFDLFIQSYLLPYYHYSTGFASVTVFSLFKTIALLSNISGLSTDDTSQTYVN